MSKATRRKLTFNQNDSITILFKNNKDHQIFKDIANKYGVELKINTVGILVAKGPKENTFDLEQRFRDIQNPPNTIEDLKQILDEVEAAEEINNDNFNALELSFKDRKGQSTVIRPKTQHQKDLIDSIMNNKVTLAMGSAGTGKSIISLAVALKLLEARKIKKIIVTKPPVDAGPAIGFLPGSELEKLSAYTLSIMNILTELVGAEKRDKLLNDGLIEIQNIGFLRGMTLGSAKMGGVLFLLDEAQNVDFHQNKMILSRIGDHPESRIVYAGDQLQSDLKYKKDALSLIHSIIHESPYVGSVIFTRSDIVRSPTVRDLMERIETYEEIESLKHIKK